MPGSSFLGINFGAGSITASDGGRIQNPQNLLRVTLSYSAAFQDFVSAADSDEAILKIYHDELPKPSVGRVHTLAEITALRPCAIIFTETDAGWTIERDAMADVGCWHPYGILHLLLFRNVPEADKDDLGKCDTDFRTTVGLIVDNLIDMSETAGRLAIDKITARGPFRTDVKELKSIGDAQVYELIINWGHR